MNFAAIIVVELRKHGMGFEEKLLQILGKWYVSMYMTMKVFQVNGKLQHLISFWGKATMDPPNILCLLHISFL